MQELEHSNHGARISSIATGNPSFADDITLITITPASLQRQVDIVQQYARQWKFEISIEKSCIVTFSSKRKPQQVNISYGKSKLKVETETVHLGMLQNSNMKVKHKITARCQKAKNAFYAISGMGLRPQGLNQTTATGIYKRIVMPVVLYGSELWHDMTHTDLLTLNRLQHLIAKSIQGFHIRTRSDMSESMLGLLRLSAEVDKRKLQFLHKILSLPNRQLCKQIFITKYCMFLKDRRSVTHGFIPDICGLLHKYSLENVLNDYMNKNSIPTKNEWKRTVSHRVYAQETELWKQRVFTDTEFSYFRQLQQRIEPCVLYKMYKNRSQRLSSELIASIWSRPMNLSNDRCTLCRLSYNDKLTHLVTECTCTGDIRDTMYKDIALLLGNGAANSLKDLNPKNLFLRLLGAQIQSNTVDASLEWQFLSTTHVFVLECMVRCVEEEITY